MTKKVNPSPTLTTPVLLQDLNSIRLWASTLTQNMHKELKDHATRLNLALECDGLDRMEAPIPLQLVLTADLPAAADWEGGIVFVTDDADGPQPFFSDGTTWYRFYDLLNLTSTLSNYFTIANNLSEGTPSTIRSNISAAAKSQVEYISGIIKAPINQSYRIIEKIPYGATLTSFTGKTAAGTLTATLKINTTAVTDGVLSATSSQSSVSPSAANSLVTNDLLDLIISSISSVSDFSFTIAYTRTFV